MGNKYPRRTLKKISKSYRMRYLRFHREQQKKERLHPPSEIIREVADNISCTNSSSPPSVVEDISSGNSDGDNIESHDSALKHVHDDEESCVGEICSQSKGSNDLPFSSNWMQIEVVHFIMDMCCHFEKMTFNSQIILFLKEATDNGKQCTCESGNNGFELKLDCFDLDIVGAEAVNHNHVDKFISEPNERINASAATMWLNSPGNAMHVTKCKWSLTVWSEEYCCVATFPKVIRIIFRTLPSSASIKWSNCKIWTRANGLNNRALFPGQDSPSCASTWQMFIHAPSVYTVTTTGDRVPIATSRSLLPVSKSCTGIHTSQWLTQYSYSRIPVPVSTLAIGVGKFDSIWVVYNNEPGCKLPTVEDNSLHHHIACMHPTYSKCYIKSKSIRTGGPLISCRLLVPTQLVQKNLSMKISRLSQYIRGALEASWEILGLHPYSRWDILIVDPLGPGAVALASPNLLIASTTLLDTPEVISHEIIHSWYGITVGSVDWCEEWITESVCIWLEDFVHYRTTELAPQAWPFAQGTFKQMRELRAIWRLQLLEGETTLNFVDEPTTGNTVPDALNPERELAQSPRLRGYFFLRRLEMIVGKEEMLMKLRFIAHTYHGTLLSGMDFLSYITPNMNSQSRTALYNKFIFTASIPKSVLSFRHPKKENAMWNLVQNLAVSWLNACDSGTCHLRVPGVKHLVSTIAIQTPIWPEVAILLLEEILDANTFPPCCIQSLYIWLKQNSCAITDDTLPPEVWHRWCELALRVKYKYAFNDCLKFVQVHPTISTAVWVEMVYADKKRARILFDKCQKQGLLDRNVKECVLQYFQD